MAAIFCLFSITLCKLASKDAPDSMGLSNDNQNSDLPISLSKPQLIKVPNMYTSPCPNHFRYTYNGKEWFGLLAVPSLPLGRTFHMRVFLSLGINYNHVSSTCGIQIKFVTKIILIIFLKFSHLFSEIRR